MNIKKHTTRAFTLVELLVVIGIIGVLIAILLPTLAAARRSAATTACLANLRSIGQALAIYKSEQKGAYPYAYYVSATVPSGATQDEGDGGNNPIDAQTYVWWSVIRGVMRGKGANMDNSVVMENGSITTRFMQAFNCPIGNNREAGCDFIANAAVFLIHNFENPNGTPAYAHNINKKIARPPTDKTVPADVAIIWDGPELANIDPPFSRQYIASYCIDVPNFAASTGGMLAEPKKPRYRYREIAIDPNDPRRGDNFPIDPGPNCEVGGTTTMVGQTAANAVGNIRWRHARNDSANFLFADGSAKTMPINRRKGTGPNPFVGEVNRKMFRPKLPPGYTPENG